MKQTVKNTRSLWALFSKVADTLGETFDKPQLVTVEPVKNKRSISQNNYLFGVCYKTILDQGEEYLRGWSKNDLHEYFKGECFGWETLEGFGRKRMKPIHGSKNLSKTEFSDYVMFVHVKAAEMGIVIPDPDPYV